MSNFERGTSRLGIDVGNVISDHQDNEVAGVNEDTPYYGDMADAMTKRSPTLECAYACRALVNHFGPENTFILSKCRTRMQLATVQMLSNPIQVAGTTEEQNFFEITGLVKRNVIFCTKASGGESEPSSKKTNKVRLVPLYKMHTAGPRVAEGEVGKGLVARGLRLTHMIDDRQDCLLSFALEGHLLSQTQLQRSVRPNVQAPQNGCLLQFWKHEPSPALPTDIGGFLLSHNVLNNKANNKQTKKQVAAIERWIMPMWIQVRGWQEVLQTFELITPFVPQEEGTNLEEEESPSVPADGVEEDTIT